MLNVFIGIFKDITSIIKGLNLTKEQAVIIVCIIISVGSIWATSHYRGEANRLEIDLHSAQKELFIERNNPKIDANIKAVKQLQSELNNKNKELVALYKKYNELLGMNTTYTEVMEGLGEINNTQDICAAWVRLYGIHLCED